MKNLNKSCLIAIVALVPAAMITGCGTGTAPDAKSPGIGAAIVGEGQVLGGQQPVQGMQIQVYAVSSSGYGGASTPLLAPGATVTSATGNFNFSAYNCPGNNPLVYVVGTGGQVIPAGGGAAAVTNSNLAMMVGVGPCNTLKNQYIYLNELTTVASVWALSPFMTDYEHVGTSSGNAIGLKNAFATIGNLANISTGSLASPSNATLPTAEINTIADILQQCVNSSGGSASDSTDGLTNGTNCGKLFYNTTTASITPNNTVAAALGMAQNPTQNVAKLNALRSAAPPFSPYLDVNSPPSAWTIAIEYVAALDSPTAIATDQAGRVWVADGYKVNLFSPLGANIGVTNQGGIYNGPTALAIDLSGHAWVANSSSDLSPNSALTVLSNNLNASYLGYYIGNGLSSPTGIAFDSVGNVWVSNTDNTISQFTNAGDAVTGSPFSGGGLSSPQAIAISPK